MHFLNGMKPFGVNPIIKPYGLSPKRTISYHLGWDFTYDIKVIAKPKIGSLHKPMRSPAKTLGLKMG